MPGGHEGVSTRAEEQAELISAKLGPQLPSVDGTATAGSLSFSADADADAEALPASIGGGDQATDIEVSFDPGSTITVPTAIRAPVKHRGLSAELPAPAVGSGAGGEGRRRANGPLFTRGP